MSDIELVYAEGREVAAGRLREALADGGYDVDVRAVQDSDAPPATAGGAAVLILWDRSTMAHAGLRQLASVARRTGRAIDVSMDGITPLGLDDEADLVVLSGWRGEPGHPGWRKMLARLDRLSPQAKRATLPHSAPAAEAGKAPSPAAAGGGRRNLLVGSAAALLLALGATGALLMYGRPSGHEAPAPPPVTAPPSVSASRIPAAKPAAAAVTAPQPTTAQGSAGAAGAANGLREPHPSGAAPAAPSPPVGAVASSCGTGAACGERPAVRSPRSHRPVRARRLHPAKPQIRYTKYAVTMRLFCQRSGRGTPECRIFNRARKR